jgi:alkanesulfonate monooxygenase SsuD/methylene tetrahydromethanopterin reductase-like flavin-dependent oxidoreductase (luciferase family)
MGANPGGAALRRVARVGDGWICRHRAGDEVADAYRGLRAQAADAGRDPAGVGLQGMVQWGSREATRDDDVRVVDAWLQCGAGRISFSGARAARTPQQHLAYVENLAEVVARFQ